MGQIVFFYLADHEILELSEFKESPSFILDRLNLELRLLILLIAVDDCVAFPPSHYREALPCRMLVFLNLPFVWDGYLRLEMREATLKENSEKYGELYKDYEHIEKYKLAYHSGTDYGLSSLSFSIVSKTFRTGRTTLDIWERKIWAKGQRTEYPSDRIEELIRRVRDEEEAPFIWERVKTVLHSMNLNGRDERLLGIRPSIGTSYLEAQQTGSLLLPRGSMVIRDLILPREQKSSVYDLLRFQRVLELSEVFHYIADTTAFGPEKILKLKYRVSHILDDIRGQLGKGLPSEGIFTNLKKRGLVEELQKAAKEIAYGLARRKKETLGHIRYEINLGLEGFLEEKGEIIDRLARSFIHYEHPEGKTVGAEAIKQFLRQFETAEKAKLALVLLQNIDFIDRKRMTEMFRHYCQKVLLMEEKSRIVLTNLGGPYDSSYLVSYFLGDTGMELGIDSTDLRSILDREESREKVILFVDDNTGSGKQAVDTFRDLLGIEEKELKERHEVRLTEKQIENFKKFKLRLFTFVGFEEGKKKFVEELTKLGLNVEEPYSFLKMEEKIGCFHPASIIFDTPEEREACKAMCSEIGYQLFSDKAAWPDELKKERSLGYGNSQKLIVFFYNVPTSTLPILWKRGKYKDEEWEPLFLRREKR